MRFPRASVPVNSSVIADTAVAATAVLALLGCGSRATGSSLLGGMQDAVKNMSVKNLKNIIEQAGLECVRQLLAGL